MSCLLSPKSAGGEGEQSRFTVFARFFGYIAVCMVVALSMAAAVQAENEFEGGSGTKDDPYLVATAEHLDNVRNHLDAYFLQTNDIDLGQPPWNQGEGWVSIGGYKDEYEPELLFNGFYDGNGYTIDNLTMRPEIDWEEGISGFGLFGAVGPGGVLINVALEGVDILIEDGGIHTGALAGYNIGAIIRCYSQGTVSDWDHYTGGLVGTNLGNITESFSSCDVTGSIDAGGFVGRNHGTIVDSYATGNLDGAEEHGLRVGGFAGDNYEGSIERCYVSGWVDGAQWEEDYPSIRPFVGANYDGVINASYWNVNVYDLDEPVDAEDTPLNADGKTTEQMQDPDTYEDWDFAKIWGLDEGFPHLRWGENIVPVVYTGEVTDIASESATLQGVVRFAGEPSAHQHGFCWNTEGMPEITDNKTEAGEVSEPGPFEAQIDGLEANVTYYVRSYAENSEGVRYGNQVSFMVQFAQQPEGEGTESEPYLIESLANLFWIADNQDSWDKHFRQTANINASSTAGWFGGEGWRPIGTSALNTFSGVYHGGGHIIDGLYINRQESSQALFGTTQGATISHLGLTNVNISGGDWYTGALVGFNRDSSISKCFATGEVSGSDRQIGGLIGRNDDESAIEYCYSMSQVTGEREIGGLVGYNPGDSEIRHSYSTGAVSGSGQYVGGLIGRHFWGELNRLYWDTESSGQDHSSGGDDVQGRTTAEMTYPYAENTFINWDFDDIWGADEDYALNYGYPFLQGVIPEYTGALQVIIEPETAQWRRAGTHEWFPSEEVEEDIPAGEYTVEFSIVPGWETQEEEVVVIQPLETTEINIEYTENDSVYDIEAEAGSEGGSVEGSGEYLHNSWVTLQAFADQGYRFLYWRDEDENIYSHDEVIEFRATEGRSFTAYFEEVKSLPGVMMLLLDDEE